VTANREIGIDVERIRPIPEANQIAKYFFSLREQNVLQSLPGNFDRSRRSTGLTLPNDSGELVRLCVQPLFPSPGYTATVALTGDIKSVLGGEWNESSSQLF